MGFLNKLPMYYLCITTTQQERFIVGYCKCTFVKIQIHEVNLFVSESAILLVKRIIHWQVTTYLYKSMSAASIIGSGSQILISMFNTW